MVAAGIVLTLSCIVFQILRRVIGQDFASLKRNMSILKKNRHQPYRSLNTSESSDLRETQIEFEPRLSKFAADLKLEIVAWKRISGEVFRRPLFALLLCTFVGSGAQITLAMFLVLFYSF